MKTYKQPAKGYEIKLELKDGSTKVLVCKLTTAQEYTEFMTKCKALEEREVAVEGMDSVLLRLNTLAEELSILFGEPAALFAANFSGAAMGEIMRDSMGELLNGSSKAPV